MRIFAIDLGDQRTGLALADDITGIASPGGLLEIPIERDGGHALLCSIYKEFNHQAGGLDTEILIGLPLNMDGTEGGRAELVRKFAQRIANLTGRTIVLVDERRTSLAADEQMARSGLTHKQKKRRRDAIAAAAIARSYLQDPDVAIGRLDPMSYRGQDACPGGEDDDSDATCGP